MSAWFGSSTPRVAQDPQPPPESDAPTHPNEPAWELVEAIETRIKQHDGARPFVTLSWAQGLDGSIDDGRIDLDNNAVERAIRPIALGRKNHLFAGSDGGADRWAVVASLLETAKLNGIEPYAYLKDVIQRMTDGHPQSQIDELLPWNWSPTDGPDPDDVQ